MSGETQNPFESVNAFFDAAADLVRLDDEMYDVLKSSYREISVQVPVRLDNAQQVALGRSRAEQALASVARSSEGARASQAETLLGVLVLTDVGPSNDPFQETAGIDPHQAQASVADFQDAVRADPANAVAKYDLELALRALLAQGIRVGAGQQTGAGATGRRGAGGGIPGSGY